MNTLVPVGIISTKPQTVTFSYKGDSYDEFPEHASDYRWRHVTRDCPQITRERKCWTLFSATILAGVLSGSVIAQTPDAGCALPSEPQGIPAALDAAIHRARADKDRDCTKALLIPEARMIFVSLGTGGAPTYRIETLDAGPAMSGEFL